MWIPKWQRDQKKGVDSPVPTQVVSNEEFIPRPQTEKQKQVEYLIGKLATEQAKKLGMDRRVFMRTSMGMATCFMASNMVYGQNWIVDKEETQDPAITQAMWPKGQYFIFDVQTHFSTFPLGFRSSEFMRNMGFQLENTRDGYSFQTFVKEMFLDSDTDMIVISGVPSAERHRDGDGNILEGRARGMGVLPSWLMHESKQKINEVAGHQRALAQGNCAPNHYWNRTTNKPDWPALFDQMEHEVKVYDIDSWKWYCHFDPGRSGGGFQLDDEEVSYPFYEKAKELGMKLFSVHKGYSSQSRTLGHLAHPGDIEKAAKDHPDLTFIIYHSAIKHGPGADDYLAENFDPTTGDLEWHSELMKIKQRNPEMTNVNVEIGSAFGSLAIIHPEVAMHLMGQNIKNYGIDHVIWGTDCLWWGSPQWVINAFERFQISDELCEKFGYAKLTNEDKAKIFGLNAARLYGVDAAQKRAAFPQDAISRLKVGYLDRGGMRDNAAYGWVRADD